MIDIQIKDVILLFAGAVIAIPITAGWQSTKAWITRREQDSLNYEKKWSDALTNNDLGIQQRAFQ